MSERLCACHGEPLQRDGTRRGYQEWRCRVKKAVRNARTNPTRISLGDTYLGTENQFPVPREAVLAFAQNLKEAHGTHG